MVIRNKDGDVVTDGAGHVDNIGETFAAELAGVEEAIDMSTYVGIHKLTIETDSNLLCKTVNEKTRNSSRCEAASI